MKSKHAPYTPMMMQYLGIKEKHPDTLIFFRLGDFYELFFHDAEIASRELGLVLTGKNAGSEERVPMCGVPHHASKNYIARLIEKGYRVGIVEQLEDPALAKGLVQRDVTQIYTPGAFMERDEGDHQFLVAIEKRDYRYTFAYADIVTGDVYLDHCPLEDHHCLAMIRKINAKEVIVSKELEPKVRSLLDNYPILISVQEDIRESGDGSIDQDFLPCFERLSSYLLHTQKRSLSFLKSPKRLSSQVRMQLDADTIQHLELVQSLKNQDKFGTLFWLLDETQTVMGSRLLKQWIVQPSYDVEVLKARYDFLEQLLDQRLIFESLRTSLDSLYDIPRILTRIQYRNANARDLLSLLKSFQNLPAIKDALSAFNGALADDFKTKIPDVSSTVNLLQHALLEDAPVSIKEGHMFKKGYDAALDEWIDLAQGGRSQLAEMENQERQRTGIKNLKISFNKVFGYYIEVSNGQLSQVLPEFGYERKQTLTNGERFMTAELKALELKLLHAQDQRIKREELLFFALLDDLMPSIPSWHVLSEMLAECDVLVSFAYTSMQYQWVRPTLNQNHHLELVKSRHPVIEKVMKKQTFVSNDLRLDNKHHTVLITGPNMGGKSTFMRQVALISIMAQIGCFVPCQQANIPLFDHIFTRMGASDDLVGGQSTFMMEMVQTQFALAEATQHSLLIFDEIGRGTSTYDGMALAQAIIEYVETNIQCITLFSTHYHELTQLDHLLPNLLNLHASVEEKDQTITFLYEMKPGSMERSYGVHVATLAGLPTTITKRASELLHQFEQSPKRQVTLEKTRIKEPSIIEKELRELDPLTLSPLAALQYIIELKKKVK